MKWTIEDINFIKNNISTMTVKEISTHIGHSYCATKAKISRLGIKSQQEKGLLWSEKEISILKENYPYASKEYLLKLFPNRSYTNISNKAKKLSLKRISQDRYYINHNAFRDWNEYSAYFIGFIIADGHICYNGDKYVQICVAERDVDILKKFIDYTEYGGKILKGHKAERNKNISGNYLSNVSSQVRVNVSNAKIVLDLIDKGVIPGNKTYTSTFLNNIPKEYVKHFIRGIIDGDGWITVSQNNYVSIGVVGTESIVNGVKNNLNEDCSTNNVRQKGEHFWDFMVNGYKAMSIIEWLYKDAKVYLDRKYNKYIEAKNLYQTKNNSKLLRRNGNIARTQL